MIDGSAACRNCTRLLHNCCGKNETGRTRQDHHHFARSFQQYPGSTIRCNDPPRIHPSHNQRANRDVARTVCLRCHPRKQREREGPEEKQCEFLSMEMRNVQEMRDSEEWRSFIVMKKGLQQQQPRHAAEEESHLQHQAKMIKQKTMRDRSEARGRERTHLRE